MSDLEIVDEPHDLTLETDQDNDVVLIWSECDPPYAFTPVEARQFAAQLLETANRLDKGGDELTQVTREIIGNGGRNYDVYEALGGAYTRNEMNRAIRAVRGS